MSDYQPEGPNPSGLCKCGCGQQTWVATSYNRKSGEVKGKPVSYCHGHHRRKSLDELIEVQSDTGCWLWKGAVDHLDRTHPYGVWRVGTKTVQAHRAMYERVRGPIPDGLHLDHLCRNTLCVNPDHLEPVNQSENLRRGRGSKLRHKDVYLIRALYHTKRLTVEQLAERYGLVPRYVQRIINRKAWRQIPLAPGEVLS
jgi:hypothetical protein